MNYFNKEVEEVEKEFETDKINRIKEWRNR